MQIRYHKGAGNKSKKCLVGYIFIQFNNVLVLISVGEPLLLSLAPGSLLRLPLKKGLAPGSWLLGAVFINFFYRLWSPLKRPGSCHPDSWLLGVVFRGFYRLPLNRFNSSGSCSSCLKYFLIAPAPSKKAGLLASRLPNTCSNYTYHFLPDSNWMGSPSKTEVSNICAVWI